ncbi:MAG: nfnB [Burkholderiaceae bacterium]|nr:nfnB [Burkholderiaceae bacterium]
MTDAVAAVDAAIRSRHSIRAYLDQPVSAELVTELLDLASRAPSSTNAQPWKVYVLTGAALKRVTGAVCQAFDSGPEQFKSVYPYYPEKFEEPFLSRRRKLGFAMYGLVGIEKGDRERMRLQARKNFEFFGAPVGLFFTLNRTLPQPYFIDYGAFCQNLMIAARARGLDSCLQLGWGDYHSVIASELKLGEEEIVFGGMALGYADMNEPINRLVPEREPVSAFATFIAD